MATIKTKRINSTFSNVEKYDFNTRDKFHRAIGAAIALGTCEFIPLPADDLGYGYYTMPAGKYFTMRPSATRDERDYGATQREQYFLTEDERTTAKHQYLIGAKKRAMKHIKTA